MRRGSGLDKGYEALLVLDRFEQWSLGQARRCGFRVVAALAAATELRYSVVMVGKNDFGIWPRYGS